MTKIKEKLSLTIQTREDGPATSLKKRKDETSSNTSEKIAKVVSSETHQSREAGNKELIFFKNGKPILTKNGQNNNAPSRELKKFNHNHEVDCIVSIILNDKYCTSRGNANYLKIIDKLIKKGHRPTKANRTGFRPTFFLVNLKQLTRPWMICPTTCIYRALS